MQAVVIGLWISVALLAAGYARTRGRGAAVWFLSALFFGPIAIYLLVVWPPAEDGPADQ